MALVSTPDESVTNSDGKTKSIVGLVDEIVADIVCSTLSDSRTWVRDECPNTRVAHTSLEQAYIRFCTKTRAYKFT